MTRSVKKEACIPIKKKLTALLIKTKEEDSQYDTRSDF